MSTTRAAAAAVLGLWLWAAAPVAARAECDAGSPGLFTGAHVNYRAMAVKGGIARLHFLNASRDTPAHAACPSNSPACREPPYVIAGDSVLAAPSKTAGFACAVYTAPGTGQTTEGFALPLSALTPTPTSPLAGADWAGSWVRRTKQTSIEPWSGDIARIEIRPRGDGRLALHGSAAPRDRSSVETARMVLTGEFEVTVEPHGAELGFSVTRDGRAAPYDAPGASPASATTPCRLRLARVGPYLLVDDNADCADGTSFSGAYRRGTG